MHGFGEGSMNWGNSDLGDESLDAICPHCGQKVRWIASMDGPIMVEREKVEIYTKQGRKMVGYLPHKCSAGEVK